MNLTRREFGGHLVKGGMAVAIGGSALMLEGCTASSDLQKVLALLPTVEAIASSVIDVIAAIDPGTGMVIKAALALIETGFASVQAIIKAYQSNISGIPPTILNELDAAVAAISSQMGAIEAQLPGISAIVAAGIQVGLAAFQAILGYLASILPAPAAAAMLPRSYGALSARGIKFGVSTLVIPSEREFAQSYNSKMDNAGFKKAHIHANWKWHVIP